jgi:hypothetical protein
MTAPFAALEARVNDAVRRHLANATADFGGGVVVDVEFGKPYVESLGLVAGSELMLRAVASLVSAVTINSTVTIDSVAYLIVRIEPDGSGMVTMQLEAT